MRHVFRDRRGQRGFTVLLALIMAPVALFLILSTISLSIKSREQAVISKNQAALKSMMDSMVDYTIYGIKNRWCFSDSWIDESGLGSCGQLIHPRSVDRLLLNAYSLRAIQDYNRSFSPPLTDPTELKSFDGTINLETVAVGHPLYEMIRTALKGGEAFKAVHFHVEKIQNKNIPSRGLETIVQITATAETTSRFALQGFPEYKTTSRIIVTPRQLSYFSLIVPQDLELDKSGTSASLGNFQLPVNANGSGIYFESPVFVNRNLTLPADGQTNRVTFGGKIYFGDGGFMKGGSPYVPQSTGGLTSQLFSQLGAGIVVARGLEMDGFADEGLPRLFDMTGGLPAAPPSQAECVKLRNAESDLAATRDSEIAALAMTPAVGTGKKWELALTKYNRFIPQGITGKQFMSTDDPSDPLLFSTTHPWTDHSGKGVVVKIDLTDVTILRKNGTPHTTPLVNMSVIMPKNSQAFLPIPGGSLTGHGFTLTTTPLGDDLNRMTVEVDLTTDPNSLHVGSFNMKVEALELGYWAGQNRRFLPDGTPKSSVYDSNYRRSFTASFGADASGGLTVLSQDATGGAIPGYLRSSTGTPMKPYPTSEFDTVSSYKDLMDACSKSSSSANGAFGGADWSQDNYFLPQTRQSWWFAGQKLADGSPVAPTPYPAPYNVTLGQGVFDVRSIYGVCTIPSSVSLVTGFYVCDELRISARSTKLKIVGTIIAGKGSIDPSAATAGITWRSIYHPQATYDLRAIQALKKFNGTDCPVMPNPAVPVWLPDPSLMDMYDNYSCNTLSLQNKADPFQWTTVNPDCGLVGSNVTPSCMRKPRRYLVREVSRESLL